MSNRRQRRLDHVKTQKGDIGKGFPSKQEARQGHTVTKYLEGQGLFEFTYYNNQWYKKKLETANQVDMTTSGKITTSELVIEEGGSANMKGAGSIIGIKAEQIENTPHAGTVTPSYIGGAIGNLKLTQPVTEKGQIGFDNGTDSFEFKQSANDKITYDGSTFKSTRDANDGNPVFQLGSSDTECLKIQTVYGSGAKGMSSVLFETLSASATADIGQFAFKVDGTKRMTLDDDDLSLFTPGSVTADKDALIIENLANAASMTDTRTSVLFNQYYYDGSSPASVNAAKITVGTLNNWTSTTSTQDAYMSFFTAFDGTMAETMKLYSNGMTAFSGPSASEYVKILPDSSDSEIDITGNFLLDVSGDIALSADGDQITMDDGTTTRFTFNVDSAPELDVTGDFTLDCSGDIALSADGDQITMDDGQGNTRFTFNLDSSPEIDVHSTGFIIDCAGTAEIECSLFTIDASSDITLDAAGGCIDFKDNDVQFAELNSGGGGGTLNLYDDASTSDYIRIHCQESGVGTISTVDSDGASGHLTIKPDGHLFLEPAVGGPKIKEMASATSDTADYGQIWVKSDTPNNLYFTDDAGNDIQLTSGLAPAIKYQYETKFIAYYASSFVYAYLPMNGYIIEGTTSTHRNEYQGFCAPYNGTIEKVTFRSEVAQDGNLSFRVLEGSDGTEIPGTTLFRKETVVDIADDTYQELDMTSPTTGSDYSPLTKGRIYQIYLSVPTIPYDTNITMVFKWDITT